MVLHKKDELKKYALLAVEDSWEKELVSPGAMDVVQKAVSCLKQMIAPLYTLTIKKAIGEISFSKP